MQTARILSATILTFAMLLRATPADAAASFASPKFAAQWDQGEAITPNFWGPLLTAREGQQEAYNESSGGKRLVQYFDKGRMELTNPASGTVTSGLLASELIRGKIQQGDNTFEIKAAPAIPIAGDLSNTGPTYAQVGGSVTLINAAASAPNTDVRIALTASGMSNLFPFPTNDPTATIGAYDTATGHNVVVSFAAFRDMVGRENIGYAIIEPFWTNVGIGGNPYNVLVQVFERRVLTYTPTNPNPFKVEFGNIGQHYYRWRYPNGAPPANVVGGNIALSPITLSNLAIANHGSSGVVSFTSNFAGCLTTEVRVIGTVIWLADPNMMGCTPRTTLTTTVTLATGDKVEVRGVARDAAGTVTIYTPNTVIIDTTASPPS